MSRPPPIIILEFTNPKTFKSEQILEANAVYSVRYEGSPINIRHLNTYTNASENGAKYKKTSFSSPAPAYNLADRLNKLFQTDMFEVFRLLDGVLITEHKPHKLVADLDDDADE